MDRNALAWPPSKAESDLRIKAAHLTCALHRRSGLLAYGVIFMPGALLRRKFAVPGDKSARRFARKSALRAFSCFSAPILVSQAGSDWLRPALIFAGDANQAGQGDNTLKSTSDRYYLDVPYIPRRMKRRHWMRMGFWRSKVVRAGRPNYGTVRDMVAWGCFDSARTFLLLKTWITSGRHALALEQPTEQCTRCS